MVDILSNPEHEGKTQKEIAVLMNITAKTVQNYLTAHFWQEIHERRLAVISESLTLVDRAVFAKAIKGRYGCGKAFL
ncbi:MAG: putative transcriptional regulator [Alphaproteobacteria bacterium]